VQHPLLLCCIAAALHPPRRIPTSQRANDWLCWVWTKSFGLDRLRTKRARILMVWRTHTEELFSGGVDRLKLLHRNHLSCIGCAEGSMKTYLRIWSCGQGSTKSCSMAHPNSSTSRCDENMRRLVLRILCGRSGGETFPADARRLPPAVAAFSQQSCYLCVERAGK